LLRGWLNGLFLGHMQQQKIKICVTYANFINEIFQIDIPQNFFHDVIVATLVLWMWACMATTAWSKNVQHNVVMQNAARIITETN
jgi:hypothetical protein